MSTELVPFESALPDPVAAKQAMTRYQELCANLLEPDDWQVTKAATPTEPERKFVKKSGWTKLAKAYRVSVEFVRETEITRDDRGRAIRASARVRATDVDGRSWESGGACSIDERGRDLSAKPEHDLPSTAETRAANRAIANLIGFGEISAEETDPVSAGENGSSPALTPLTDEQARALAGELQANWPQIDGHGFERMITSVLAHEYGTAGVPAIADRVLRGFVWWARQPAGTGSIRAQDEQLDAAASSERRDVPPTT